MQELPFEQALDYVTGRLRAQYGELPLALRRDAHELRLRAGRSPSFTAKGREYSMGGAPVTRQELDDCFRLACECSVHSHAGDIAQGFLTVRGGHRIGLCGTASMQGDRVASVRDIAGLNIRIARQVKGCADALMGQVFERGGTSLLLVGPPGSGKTTVLRDLCRQLGSRFPVSLIDVRGEVAAVYRGIPQNDVGVMTDVFDDYPKAEGILTALRVMAPRMLVCDEIGGAEDAAALEACLYAGVHILATAHAGSIKEAVKRPQLAGLLRMGAFDRLALLDTAEHAGHIQEIAEVESLGLEACGSGGNSVCGGHSGHAFRGTSFGANGGTRGDLAHA